MSRLRYNNQAGLLGGDPGVSGTALSFDSAPDFATLVSPDVIPLILDSGSNLFEIVWVTAYTVGATTATVIRAAEDAGNWPAVAHPGPGRWAHGPTIADYVPSLSGPDIIPGTVQTTSYTLTLADRGSVIEMDSTTPVNLIIPTNASVPFPIGEVIQVCQKGTGQVSVTGSGGVTRRMASSNTTRAQWSTLTLRQRAFDEWVIGGDAT